MELLNEGFSSFYSPNLDVMRHLCRTVRDKSRFTFDKDATGEKK